MPRITHLACGFLLLVQTSAPAGELPDGAFAQFGGSAFRHPDKPTALAYRPDGRHLASGGADGTVRIWDTNGVEVATLKVKDGAATILAYTPDGKHFLAHFCDEKVRIYDVANDYKQLRTVAVKNLETLSFTDDLKYLAGATTLGQLLVVESATGLDRMEIPEGRAIAITPDGSAVAAANSAHVVNVYEVPSGKPLAQFPPPKGGKSVVTGIAYSADGKRLAVSTEGAASRVRIFDVSKKDPLLTIDGETPMAFCGDGRFALRQANGLALYDLGTSKRLHFLDGKFTALAITPDGAQAATDAPAGFATARLRLWNLKDGAERFAKSDRAVDLLGVVPAGADGDNYVMHRKGISTWSVGREPIRIFEQKKPIVAFARSDSAIYVADTGRILKVTLSGREAKLGRELDAYPGGVRPLAVSADDALIAAATAGDQPKLLLGNADKVNATIALPAAALAIAIHPAKKSVAVICRDGLLRVWDTAGGDKAPELWKARVARSLQAQVAYSPDGERIAVTSVVRVGVFDAKTGAVVANFERQWEDGPYSRVAFTPDNRLLIAGTQGTAGAVVVWELATNSVVRRFAGVRGSIAHLGVTADGRTLSTLGADDNVLLWDLTGRRGQLAPIEKQLKSAWVRLGAVDAEIGWPAVEILRAGGDASLPIVKAGIADAATALRKIDRLIGELGSKEFTVRDAATKDLAKIGAPALAALKIAEAAATNVELRERAETLIGTIASAGEKLPDSGLVGEPLRLLRAVAVLEASKATAVKDRLDEIRVLGGIPGAAAEKALKSR